MVFNEPNPYPQARGQGDDSLCRTGNRKETVMDLEIWKNIEGYTGIYSISNMRRIKRNECEITESRGRVLHLKEHIFSARKNGHVSLRIGLKKTADVNINDLFYKYFPEQIPSIDETVSEEWKDISGFEGIYQVSDKGNVRRIYLLRMNHGIKTRILKNHQCKSNGYLVVSLSKGGKVSHKCVHRLVARAFLPNPHNLPCVNHKDETRTNNHASNLEWCTYKYNTNYGTAQLRHSVNVINKGRSIPIEKRDENGTLLETFPSIAEVTRILGYDSAHISHSIKNNKLAYGFKWIRKS